MTKLSHSATFFLGIINYPHMPYGKSYGTRGRTYRRRAPYRKRALAAPPKKKTTRTYVRKNALVNRRQSRQISQLWNRQYGALQQNLQKSSNGITLTAPSPILFDCSDFTSERVNVGGISSLGCRIWHVNPSSTDINIAAHWTTTSFNGNGYWASTNKDLVGDTGRYKPVAAYYTIQFSCRSQATAAPPHVTLHVFSQKAGFFVKNALAPPSMDSDNLIMPNGLVHLTNMADEYSNMFNPMYFKMYTFKKMVLQKNTAAAGSSGMNAQYEMKFAVRPKKERLQADTAPNVPGTVDQEVGMSAAGSYGWLNVDPRTPLWAMVSSTTAAGSTDNIVVAKLIRRVLWRDGFGSTKLI